jgi:hypothetical protein
MRYYNQLKQIYNLRTKRLRETLTDEQYRKWVRIKDEDEYLKVDSINTKHIKSPKFLIKNPQFSISKSMLVFVLNDKWKDENNEIVCGLKMERRSERRVGDLVVWFVE